MKYTAV